ncbi:MAG: alpha/beta fold hydrolase [Colwellia sp.]|nr:alpha/beta fold hydrolase [Colwellia sp.]
MTSNPEIGKSIKANGIKTNYHDVGKGDAVLLIHGSGPGVSAWANWRLNIPELAKNHRVIAPDMVGFGYTERPTDNHYSMDDWVEQVIGLLDALNIDKAAVVGNSFGGGLALAIAIRYPERVNKLVLMGSVGVSFDLTEGLDKVWGYQPSIANMKQLLDIFAYNRALVSDELAELRYKASIQEGFQESFSSMFPAPRQRWIEAMQSTSEDIQHIEHKTLIIHGRDDKVIPLDNAYKLIELIKHAQLHVYSECGHWIQIEKMAEFNQLVSNFLQKSLADNYDN